MADEKKKKTPCEECRDQKRKCNGEIPCERCMKFNLSCVYTSTRSPFDEEYLDIARQAALVEQIQTMRNQMEDMEKWMAQSERSHSMDSAYSPNHSLPSLMEDDHMGSISSLDEIHSVECLPSIHEGKPYFDCPLQRKQLIGSLGAEVNAFLTTDITTEQQEEANSSKITPWTLTFEKGDIVVHTHVKTHSDLLDNLYHMMGTVELLNFIPPNVPSYFQQNSLMGVLNVLIRKKYGKMQCRNVARSVQIYITPDLSSVKTIVVAQAPDSIQVTTTKLLRAYLQCKHLQHLAIHAPTFIRLFIDRTDGIENSPAAMALCAAICTFRCKHVADCLPSISLVEYGKFYFDRARDLLSDLFDQFDLETFTCYTLMVVYKLTLSHRKEALAYADMAERISLILEPSYDYIIQSDASLQKKGEAVHFKRLLNHLHRVLTYQQVSRTDPGEHMKVANQDLPFCTLMKMGEGTWVTAQDDSVQEKWFSRYHGYVLQFHRSCHLASKSARSCDLHQLIMLIGHQVEMAMRHWYAQVLPAEFKLSLPLFNSTMDPQEFYSTLDRECSHSVIPILTTLTLYEEWIIFSQTYLPKAVPSPENDWGRLNDVWNGGSDVSDKKNKKWKKRIDKLMELRQAIEFEGTDQEYLAAVNHILGSAEAQVNCKLLISGLDAAFITLDLIKYLRSRTQDCYFDIKVLINAWQLLLTVSKLHTTFPKEIQAFVPRIHKALTDCMQIVKDELKLQPYQGKVGDYVHVMENDLKSQVVDDDDDCDCTSCPNA
ncbi:hypothetical protein INT47_012535 [Mucor saturninus]|uniref:Zn(2)-C6 fungal-type domain-containing protein n=1 Tax=Mucor saturninus TaxID=64648 RepID=A0A8H7R1A0_9FUNG|nr:hypothetical protein INT47_012535 [Mucor saturninus]